MLCSQAAMSQPAFPFIDVSGPAAERGRQYGRAAAERIRRSVALHGGRLSPLGLGGCGLRALVDGFLPRIDALGPDHVVEIRGIAITANDLECDRDDAREGVPLALIVMEPAAGIMEVAPPPAGTCVFTRYSLDDAPVTPAA